MSSNNRIEIFYSILFILIVTFFLFMNPFLRYPFDMYAHLELIDKNYFNSSIPKNREFWHWIWAKIFYFFNIDNSQIFLRAYVIHYVQILISFGAVFYLSKVVIKYFFIDINNFDIKYLSLWSTFIWFTIYATQSMGFHQVWILWYSINYQITLPIVLFMLGITISLLYSSHNIYYRIFYIFIILFLAIIVVKMHVMELLYYLMYVFTLGIIYIDKIFIYIRKNIYISIGIFSGVGLFIIKLPVLLSHIESKSSRIIPYLHFSKIHELYYQIMRDGAILIHGRNRAQDSINELIYVSIFLIIILILFIIFRYIKFKRCDINVRLLLFLVITTLFVLIPTFQFTSGLAGILVSSIDVVNRFYYSSLIFLVIPIFTYYFIKIVGRKNIFYVNIAIISILISTLIYSKYYSQNHNYYKNIKSIVNSYDKKNVGFHLNKEQIKEIGKLRDIYKKKLNINKPYFFAREDIAFVLKFIYREKVDLPEHYNGGYLNINFFIKDFNKTKSNNKILFETPNNFPNYTPYK